MDRVPRVLIFDSGVGGLSVAQCVHQALPGVDLVYLADNAAFPYGDQPEAVVVERCCGLIGRALADGDFDVVVVACNTASTVVLPPLRAMTRVPVVGVVPAVKPAAGKTRNHRIGLLATPATVQRPYLDDLVRTFAADCQVERIGHPGLVRWAEAFVRGVPVPREELANALTAFRTAGVDTVVLGCTHYPLLLASLKDALPEVRFWVDSGEAIARRVAWLLEQSGRLAEAREPAENGFPPVSAALFSGTAPEGVADFMAALGLPPARVASAWPDVEPGTSGPGTSESGTTAGE